MIELLFVCVVLMAVVAVAALAVTGYAVIQLRDVSVSATEVARAANQSLAMVKGLAPHTAAPDIFDPNGVAIETNARAAVHAVDGARERNKIRILQEKRDALTYFTKLGNEPRMKQLQSEIEAIAKN